MMEIQSATYADALAFYHPGVKTIFIDGDGIDYDGIKWTGGEPLPLKSELDSHIKDLNKDKVWRLIQEIRDTKKHGGVDVDGYWFHSDDTSRIQQIGLVMLGAKLPSNLQWKTMSNTYVTMTPDLAMKIFLAVASSDQYFFMQAEIHRQNMLQLENPLNYDFTVGWKKVFGE